MKQLLIDTNVYVAFKRNDPEVIELLRQAECVFRTKSATDSD